jgi:hypothetical protein
VVASLILYETYECPFSVIARSGTHFQDNFLCIPGTFTLQVSAGQSRGKSFYLLWIPAYAGMTKKRTVIHKTFNPRAMNVL